MRTFKDPGEIYIALSRKEMVDLGGAPIAATFSFCEFDYMAGKPMTVALVKGKGNDADVLKRAEAYARIWATARIAESMGDL